MAFRVLILCLASTATAAIAHAPVTETAPVVLPIAEPEPLPPIIWLAPPPKSGSFETPDGEAPPALLTLYLPPPPSPNAVALPPAARAVLEQAMDAHDTATFAAVEKAAREQYPDGGPQIDALAAKNAAQIAEKQAADARAKAEALARPPFLAMEGRD